MKTTIKVEMEFFVDVANFYEQNSEWQRGFNGSVKEFTEELSKFINDHPFVIGCNVTTTRQV